MALNLLQTSIFHLHTSTTLVFRQFLTKFPFAVQLLSPSPLHGAWVQSTRLLPAIGLGASALVLIIINPFSYQVNFITRGYKASLFSPPTSQVPSIPPALYQVPPTYLRSRLRYMVFCPLGAVKFPQGSLICVNIRQSIPDTWVISRATADALRCMLAVVFERHTTDTNDEDYCSFDQ